ncbi:MAG: tripartite tricarboxylate transporter substrate binding protein [Gammaproteobacteria bacterium]|nr:tripartite tricarboxylate transporter substrate binding protein [Gammaproteobacteria bacterium]
MTFKLFVDGSTRSLLAIFALALAQLLVATSAEAADTSYPSKPIRFLVTNGPGSGSDVMARLIAHKLTEAWGQQVVVDNRPGAGGNIGGEIAANASPDGYTIMLVTSSNAIAMALFKKLNYDLRKDFSPIARLGAAAYMLVVNPSLNVASVKDLIELAKSAPGKLNYASSNIGSGVHLAAEIFTSMTGTKIVHIPYRGLGAALTGLMGKQVQMAFAITTAVTPHVKAGRLKALGVSSLERSPLAPDVPAISESVPGYEAIGWYGVVAPRGTSSNIVAKANRDLIQAFNTTEVKDRLALLGVTPMTSTPRAFGVFIDRKIEEYRKVIKAAGIRLQ